MHLTDDEIGMLYWLREFPNRSVDIDATILSLMAKGLVDYKGETISVTAEGMLWPDLSKLK